MPLMTPAQLTDAGYDSGAYNRGWRSSASWTGSEPAPLDRADSRDERPEWYDGYLDHAAGRRKWTTATAVAITPAGQNWGPARDQLDAEDLT